MRAQVGVEVGAGGHECVLQGCRGPEARQIEQLHMLIVVGRLFGGLAGTLCCHCPRKQCSPARRGLPAAYISACAGVVLLLSALLQPFMPSFTAKLLAQLGVEQVRQRFAPPLALPARLPCSQLPQPQALLVDPTPAGWPSAPLVGLLTEPPLLGRVAALSFL